MTDFYRVAEFAKLAGVTVRTLQYYDRIDLLKPAETTEGGHRLYLRSDLLQLQQILTLKWMGFKLDQIKDLLDSPSYDLRTALQMQKAAIDSQIAHLKEASDALSVALEAKQLQVGSIDSEAIRKVIRAVMTPTEAWLQDAYSDEAWAGIATRRLQYTEADFEQFAEDWRTLIEQFEEIQHLPADSEPVQNLAATMSEYISLFSADDKETELGIAKVWENRDKMPEAYRKSAPSPDLLHFMNRAMTIYRQRRDK